MAEGSIITDEMKKMVGRPWAPQIFKVEEGAIRRYAAAIDDANPLYNDAGYARKSKYGRLKSPPGFAGWPEKKARLLGIQVSEALMAAGGPPRPLDGGIEFEFLRPVLAGDTLVETTTIINLAERDTKTGKSLFTQVEYAYANKDGDVALRSVATYIYR